MRRPGRVQAWDMEPSEPWLDAGFEQRSKCYPADLTDAEWLAIQPFLPASLKRGREPEADLHDVLDALRYLVRAGGEWPMLSNDFLPQQTIYSWLGRFVRRPLFRSIHNVALMLDRKREERAEPVYQGANGKKKRALTRRACDRQRGRGRSQAWRCRRIFSSRNASAMRVSVSTSSVLVRRIPASALSALLDAASASANSTSACSRSTSCRLSC